MFIGLEAGEGDLLEDLDLSCEVSFSSGDPDLLLLPAIEDPEVLRRAGGTAKTKVISAYKVFR